MTFVNEAKVSFIGWVRDQLLQCFDRLLTADVKMPHGWCQTFLQDSLINVKQPHYQSPNYSSKYPKPILPLPHRLLPILLYPFRIIFFVKVLNARYDDPTKQVQVDLIIYWCLLAENDASYYKPCNKTIQRSFSDHLREHNANRLVEEHKSA